jgi:hypothetical protein
MEKLKKGIISSLAKILATVDTSKMSSESRVAIVRNFIATKLVANEIATLEEETGKKLITDEFKELQAKETKTEEETKRFTELTEQINKEYVDVLNSNLNEEIDIDLKTMSEDDFDKLIGEIVDLKPNQFDLIHEVLVK